MTAVIGKTHQQNGEGVHDSSTIKNINNLLNSAKTRTSGLEQLDAFLPQCSDEDFIAWCVSWMQQCCKVDVDTKHSDHSIQMLDNLLKISENYPELKKSVSFFIATRFLDYFFKYFLNSEAGWRCALTCFELYRGACGPFQDTIKKHLERQVERNSKVSPVVAECFALLPSLGGGGNDGINYKTNWKSQCLKLVDVCHSILNDLFVDVDELQEYDNAGHSYKNADNEITMEYLTVQLHNHCSALIFMLLNKYPAPKCIPSDLILQVICRGLAVNPTNLGKKQTAAILALQKVLPEVHATLHSLLTALVVTCGSRLLPHSLLICKLIRQSLEWTDFDFVYGSEKPFSDLRIAAYETLGNWLVATRNGSCIETVANVVVRSAVSDIHSKKSVTLLKEPKHQNSKEQTRRRVDPFANSSLCYAALKALQFVVKFSGIMLKVEEHKFLQEVVVKLLVDIQNSSISEMLVPYSVSTCRKELYSLLMELTTQSCRCCPPPTHFALRIFSRGQNDTCYDVSQFCSTALNYLTNIIHSQFDNGRLTIESETVERGRRQAEGRLQWRSEAMEMEMEGESNLQNHDDLRIENPHSCDENPIDSATPEVAAAESETDLGEKLSNQEESDASSHEDSIITVQYPKGGKDNDKEVLGATEEDVNERGSSSEDFEPVRKKSKTVEEPTPPSTTLQWSPDKVKSPQEYPEKVKSQQESPEKVKPPQESPEKVKSPQESPEKVKSTQESPEKVKSPQDSPEKVKATQKTTNNQSEDSESPNDEKPKDSHSRYFLRSKTPCKTSSEESEDRTKGTSSPETVRTGTPTRGLFKGVLSSRKKPRMRSKPKLETVEDEDENEGRDEDEDIIDSFHDSFVE